MRLIKTNMILNEFSIGDEIMRLIKYTLFVLLFICLTGCSYRIVKYSTYDDSELNGKKPAVLFVTQRFYYISIDGKMVPKPFLSGPGGYGGRYIYLSPGEHTVAFNYDFGTCTYRNVQKYILNAKENMYYKLSPGADAFKFEETEMPKDLQTSLPNMK